MSRDPTTHKLYKEQMSNLAYLKNINQGRSQGLKVVG